MNQLQKYELAKQAFFQPNNYTFFEDTRRANDAKNNWNNTVGDISPNNKMGFGNFGRLAGGYKAYNQLGNTPFIGKRLQGAAASPDVTKYYNQAKPLVDSFKPLLNKTFGNFNLGGGQQS